MNKSGFQIVILLMGISIAAHSDLGAESPRVVSVSPLPQSLTAEPLTSIVISFDMPVDRNSINDTTVNVFGRWSGAARGVYLFENNDTRIRFDPMAAFSAGEWITVSISKDVTDKSGEGMTFGYAWNFWIRSETGTLDLTEIQQIPVRRPGEGHIQTYGTYAGDLNEDGFTDFTVPNELSNDIRVFINDGGGGYDDFTIYMIPNGSLPSTNEGADLNRDGHIDFPVGNSGGDSVSVFIGDGTGGFSSVTNYPASTGIRGLSVMDIDGDGDTDIVTANRAADNISILFNDGNGGFPTTTNIETDGEGETACAAADANGDGLLDLFVGAYGSNEMILLLSDGNGGLTLRSRVPAGGKPWMITAGDVNGDGNVDIVSANSSSNNASIIFGDGEGNLEPAVSYNTGGFPLAIDLGDIDGDGDLDMVTSNFSGRSWTLYENQGDGTFANRRTYPATSAGSCATLHDRDNDGDLDMTGIDEVDDVIFLFDNEPSTGIHDGIVNNDIELPRTFLLMQNYPNPFNPITTIQYTLNEYAPVVLTVYDLMGRKVRTLVDTEQNPGQKTVQWDGRNAFGATVSSGIYVYQLSVDARRESRKMFLIK